MGKNKNSKSSRSFLLIKSIMIGTAAVALSGFVAVGIVSLNALPDETLPHTETSETESIAPKETVIEALGERETHEVSIISGDELSSIEESYSLTPQRFFVGALFGSDPDGTGRPTVVNEMAASFEENGLFAKFYCSAANEKKVSFIFQAEGDGTYIEQVLDILAEAGIKSTFFVTRAFEGNHSDIIRRMITEGHEIGNRSYLDPADGIVQRSLQDQMNDARNLHDYMIRTYQYTMQKYSFNEDMWSEASVALMTKMGYEVCFGSINITDDTTDPLDADSILRSLENGLHPGAVYSFHLVNSVVPEILPDLIDYCVQEGYVLKQLD